MIFGRTDSARGPGLCDGSGKRAAWLILAKLVFIREERERLKGGEGRARVSEKNPFYIDAELKTSGCRKSQKAIEIWFGELFVGYDSVSDKNTKEREIEICRYFYTHFRVVVSNVDGA